MTAVKTGDCKFCNPKKKDWEERGFYGYRCSSCQGNTAFIITTEHRGTITPEEKTIVNELARKHYPQLKIKWISDRRKHMAHWYDFLAP